MDEREDVVQGTGVVDPAAQAQAQQVSGDLQELDKSIKSGGGWFYTIAVLSIINSLITLFHGSMSFVVGLGVTQFFDAAMREFGTKAALIILPVNLIIAGIYFALGHFSNKRVKWAFITGMVLYALDGLLLLLVKEFLGLAFHAYALYCIYRGFKALDSYTKLEASTRSQSIV